MLFETRKIKGWITNATLFEDLNEFIRQIDINLYFRKYCNYKLSECLYNMLLLCKIGGHKLNCARNINEIL
jgi:hypothetical protein